MVKDRFFIRTGAFGSGKSTLLQHLQTLGIGGVAEPARPILAQQRSVHGNGLPEKDPRLFVELRAIYERFGYTLIDLPCAPVEERAAFVLHHIRAD